MSDDGYSVILPPLDEGWHNVTITLGAQGQTRTYVDGVLTNGALPPVPDDCYPPDAVALPVEYAPDPNPFPRVRLFSWLRG